MEYTLMHKNISVADLDIDEDTGTIIKILDILDKQHLPVGIHEHKSGIDRKGLDDWWKGRSIPASRDGIRKALETLEIYNTALLLTKCYGLSLSDQYWVCAKDSGLKWEMVNFFDNSFSKDIGEILFGREPEDPAHVSLISPDNTSDGWLRKKWIIADGKRYLMKGGSGVFMQEPYNEIAASAIMRRLNINHIPYTLMIDNEKPYSLCENFITRETELVPAWRVWETLKKKNSDSNLAHLLRCCESLGMPDVRGSIEKMLVLDYIISNEDRHYNNFGFIRDAQTLQWLGMAPVYDSGTSLWYNTPHVGSPVECKPFRSRHEEQIKLVSDFSWWSADALEGLHDEIIEIFATSDRVDEKRREMIATVVDKRCKNIETISAVYPNVTGDAIVSDSAVQYESSDTRLPIDKLISPEEGKLYTYADYCTWTDEKRYELIDGVVYAMSAPTWEHQDISGELFTQLKNYLKGKTCKVFIAPFDVRLNADKKDDTVVQPDVVVICDRSIISKTGCAGAPDMVAEVISPGSAQHDRLRKMRLYEKSGIREYWLLDPETKILHVHILKDGQYFLKAYGGTEKAPVDVLDDCVIDLSDVFAGWPE